MQIWASVLAAQWDFWTHYCTFHAIWFASCLCTWGFPTDCSHLGSWSSRNTLTGQFEHQRRQNDITANPTGGTFGGSTKSLEQSPLKGQADSRAVWEIYVVWCDGHGMLFVGSSLGRTVWHFCGMKPNQLWFIPPQHQAEGWPVTQPLHKMYCEG